MVDTATHLVERVLPSAPYLQWVFTVPKALRLRLARDPEWTTWVGNLAVRALGAWQRRVNAADDAQANFVQGRASYAGIRTSNEKLGLWQLSRGGPIAPRASALAHYA